MHRDAERRAHEAGFTLVELLVAIALLGLLGATLVNAFTVGMNTIGTASDEFTNGNDLRMLQLYFVADVQSTGNGATDVVIPPPANTSCSGASNVLVLHWSATETPGVTNSYTSAYAVQQSAGSSWQLVRFYCVNNGSPTTMTLVHNLPTASSASAQASGTQVSLTVTQSTRAGSSTTTVSATRRTS